MLMAPPTTTPMQAIVRSRYGSPDTLSLQEIEKPAVDDDAVLVRVLAASVNPYDWHMMRGEPYLIRMSEGVRRPKTSVLGVDMAGRVEAVGKNVTGVRPGDEVFGWGDGTFAEYVRTKENSCLPIPRPLTPDQAAAIPIAGCTALQCLRDTGHLEAGQSVLINGASGGVGHFAVQIAAAFGAEVTGVCSTRNVDLVRSLGAQQVIDYTRDDFTRMGTLYDLVLDLIGNHSLSGLRRVMKPEGAVVIAGGGRGRWLGALALPLQAMIVSKFVRDRLVTCFARLKREDAMTLSELVETGKLTPMIDRTYPLAETPDAVRHVEARHARGKVIISV